MEPRSRRGNPDVGERIKSRREELEMSRAELAEEIGGVKYGYIAQLESGYRNASHSQQLKIARALGVGLDYLFNPEGRREALPESVAASVLSSSPCDTYTPGPLLPTRPTLTEAVTAAAGAIGRLPSAVRLEALNQVQKVVLESLIPSNRIEKLQPNEVFVFGSDPRGEHDGGAARLALERFGAVWGQGHGRQGSSYAIDTMSGFDTLAAQVRTFLGYARKHPELRFLVTPIGTGIAGHRAQQVAPLFTERPGNVILPPEFNAVLVEES